MKRERLGPEGRTLGRVLAAATQSGRQGVTRPTGTQVAHAEDGTRVIIGPGAGPAGVVAFVGDTTPPPVPSVPIVGSEAGLVAVRWDGAWSGGEVTPEDYDHIDVLVDGAVRGRVVASNDTAVVEGLTPGDEVSVTLRSVDRARDQSGAPAPNVSAESAPSLVTVTAPVDAEAVQEAIDAGVAAQNAADAAAAAAAAASGKADDAEAAAAAAAGIAEGKGRVIIQASAPAGEANSLWIKTPENIPHTWDGSQWVARTDQAALDAAELAAEAAGAADAATAAAEAAQAAASAAAITASAARSSADGAITWSTAVPADTPANPNALWMRYDGSGRVISQWEWTGPGTGWVQRQIDNAVIANLDAGKITAGLLDAARIAAGSITVEKLLVGTAVNLVPDPGFDNPAAWQGSSMVAATGGRLAGGSLLIPQSSSLSGAYMTTTAAGLPFAIPVVPGERYLVSGWVRFETAAPTAAGRAVLYARWWNPATSSWSAQAVVASSPAGVAVNTWVYIEGEAVAPTTATHLSVGAYKVAAHSTGAVRWDDITVKEKVTGQLLVDGAIDGKTVTGATIRTSATVGNVSSGQGVILDSAGLRAHQADGVRTFDVDAATGAVSIVGRLQAEGPNHNIEVGANTVGGVFTGSMSFWNKNRTERVAGVQLNSNATSYWPLSIFSRDDIDMQSNRAPITARAGDGITRTSGTSGSSALTLAVEGAPQGGSGGASLGYTRWTHSASSKTAASSSVVGVTNDGGAYLTAVPTTASGRPVAHLLIRDGYFYPYAAANTSSPQTQALTRLDLNTGTWQTRSGTTWTDVVTTAPVMPVIGMSFVASAGYTGNAWTRVPIPTTVDANRSNAHSGVFTLTTTPATRRDITVATAGLYQVTATLLTGMDYGARIQSSAGLVAGAFGNGVLGYANVMGTMRLPAGGRIWTEIFRYASQPDANVSGDIQIVRLSD